MITGTSVFVTITCQYFLNSGSTSGNGGYIGFTINGSTNRTASDNQALIFSGRNETDIEQCSATFYVTGLTQGTNTFQLVYRMQLAGDTGSFSNRSIIVERYN